MMMPGTDTSRFTSSADTSRILVTPKLPRSRICSAGVLESGRGSERANATAVRVASSNCKHVHVLEVQGSTSTRSPGQGFKLQRAHCTYHREVLIGRLQQTILQDRVILRYVC